MKVNRYIYFRVDLCVGTPVDKLKGHCRKIRNKLNRYSDGQVHMWTCRTVETVDLNGYQNESENEQVGS